MSHRQFPKKSKKRERNLRDAKNRATISTDEVSTSGPSGPEITRPKSWTPEFCRGHERRANDAEDYGFAREWRMRAFVLEHHSAQLVRETNRPHPYRFMRVDDSGREISAIELTSATKETILGSAECEITHLPVTA